MSSLIGHLSAGVAVYLGHSRWGDKSERSLLPLFGLLAVLPDFDYFAYWLFWINPQPRFTHSLAFCLAASSLAGALLRLRRGLGCRTFLALCLASCSHLILDGLVGVHPVPVFWPLLVPELQSPIGLLPSAGHLSLTNHYLWRNLLIECGVLLPAFALFVAVARSSPFRTVLPRVVLVLPLWLAFLIWSIRVHA